MQKTPSPAPKRDYIAEIEACEDLKSLCLLRDSLSDLIEKKEVGWERAASYRKMISDQISSMTERGYFLSPAGDVPMVPLSRLREALEHGNVLLHEARAFANHIEELDPDLNDVKEANTLAKEFLGRLHPSPTAE